MRYGYSLPARDDEQLHGEIAALAVAGFQGVCGSGAGIEVVFAGTLSAPDKLRLDAAVAAHSPDPAAPANRTRAPATALLVATDPTARVLRAVALVLMDEVNLLRARLRAVERAIPTAPTFAAYQLAVAALPALPDRTPAQTAAAILARVNSQASD